jgi:hypothetical protein
MVVSPALEMIDGQRLYKIYQIVLHNAIAGLAAVPDYYSSNR